MKDGELHGSWKWFRRDGSLMRTGSFSHGTRTGTWETWDADGRVVTTRSF
jgi:antitoxin component YwqK of YwqJK toxin-antitoxin module